MVQTLERSKTLEETAESFVPADEKDETYLHEDICVRCRQEFKCSGAHEPSFATCDLCLVSAMAEGFRRRREQS